MDERQRAERADMEAPLVGEGEGDGEGKGEVNYGRDVNILCGAFLLIFLAYGAAQNLESSVNTEGGLGTTSLGVLYVSFMVFSVVASLVVRFLGSKRALILGTSGYWVFIAANLAPSWYTMIPSSLYLGFSASIIWVSQGTYLTSTARAHAAALSHMHLPTLIGRYNGLFWAVFACHQVIGNLISLALLSHGSDGNTTGTTLLFLVFLCSMTLGTILMCFLQSRDSKPDLHSQTTSFLSLSKSLITPLLNLRMLLIVPLIAYSGLQQAFVWAEFTKDIVTPKLGVSGVGGTMALYGATDAIFSLAAGRLTSGLKSITLIVSAGVFAQAIVFFWILLKYSVISSGAGGVLYPFVMAALLGIGDGVLNTQLNALLGMLFKHDTEGAFAQLKVWQSALIAVVFFLSPNISLEAMVWIMVAGICVSYTAFLVLTLVVEKAFSSSTHL